MPYPRTIGLSWSVDGRLAVFASDRYNVKKIVDKNRRIRSIKEISQFITGVAVLGQDDKAEDLAAVVQGSPSRSPIAEKVREGLFELHTESLQDKSSLDADPTVDVCDTFPQLFRQSTWDSPSIVAKKRESQFRAKEPKAQAPTLTLHSPIERMCGAKELGRRLLLWDPDVYSLCLVRRLLLSHIL